MLMLSRSTFRLCCKARAEKYEQKNVKYGVLAKVVREGGFFFVVMCRLSARVMRDIMATVSLYRSS